MLMIVGLNSVFDIALVNALISIIEKALVDIGLDETQALLISKKRDRNTIIHALENELKVTGRHIIIGKKINMWGSFLMRTLIS